MKLTCVLGFSLLFLPTLVHSQTRLGYVPIEPDASGKTPATKPTTHWNSHLYDAAVPGKPNTSTYVPPGLSCTNPPTADDLLNAGFDFYYSFATAQDVANLKLPIASFGAGANTVYLVEDLAYELPCVATDGRTILNYGMGFRSVLSIQSWDAKLAVTYGIVAADATLNHHAVQMSAKLIGLRNAVFPATVTSPGLKDFNVDNLVDYRKAQGDVLGKIEATETTRTPQIMGAVAIVDPTDLIKATASSFALTNIAAGNSCKQAQAAHFDDRAIYPHQAIGDTYASMLGITTCDDTPPNEGQKQKASEYLAGLKTIKR